MGVFVHTLNVVERPANFPPYKWEATCTCGWQARMAFKENVVDASTQHIARNAPMQGPATDYIKVQKAPAEADATKVGGAPDTPIPPGKPSDTPTPTSATPTSTDVAATDQQQADASRGSKRGRG